MKPRLQISLTPAAREVVRRLAVSQKVPASRVVSELIEDATPMLAKMADTLESMATAAQVHKDRIRLALVESEHDARAAAATVVKLLDDMAAQARNEATRAAEGTPAGGGAAARAPRRPPPAPPLSNRGATPHRRHPKPRPPRVSR